MAERFPFHLAIPVNDLNSKTHYITANNAADNKLQMILNTEDDRVSPIIHRDSLSLNTREYVIGESEEDGTSVYISKRISLGNLADQINGWISINRPTAAANVLVYIQAYDANGEIILEELEDDITKNEWWEIKPTNPSVIPTNSDRDIYSEVQFIRNFEDIMEFSSFAIKLVLTSSNIVDIPSCKDLRFIATS